MRRAFALMSVSILTLWGIPAGAGAWLRAEGDGFLSWATKVQDGEAAKTYSTIYAEYGANPDLTLGLDMGSDETGDHKALAFVLMPLSREGVHVAFELAAGTLGEGPALRPGLSVGKGLTLGDFSGWWSVDTQASITPGDVALAVDATLGVTLWEETQLIGQMQQGGPLIDPDFIRLSGSLVWPIAPGRKMEVGLSTGLKDAEDFGVKLGLWHSF